LKLKPFVAREFGRKVRLAPKPKQQKREGGKEKEEPERKATMVQTSLKKTKNSNNYRPVLGSMDLPKLNLLRKALRETNGSKKTKKRKKRGKRQNPM